MRVIYFGTPAFSASFLQALLDDPFFVVVGLVCQTDEPQGRKKILTPPATKQTFLTRHSDRPVFQPTKLKDPAFAESLRTLNADAFVIVAYGRIIPQHILDIPRLGNINVHPSLLPKWRGPSPMQAAIAHGDNETGITIMLIDAEMDHGPLLAQIRFPLTKNETTPSLTEKVINLGAPLLLETLKKLAQGAITPQEQNHPQATYCKLLSREDGRINWQEPAEVIEQKLRAYTPWPGLSTAFILQDGAKIEVKIHQLAYTDRKLQPGKLVIENKRLFFGTATNALEILELQPVTKQKMSTKDFLNGVGTIISLEN